MKGFLFLLFFLSPFGYPERYPFLLSTSSGMMKEGGINLITAYNLTNRILDYVPLKQGIVGRIGKAILLDSPISIWTTVTQHEYFGHGARGREFGVLCSYELYLPWEYWLFGKKRRAYIFFKQGYPEGINERLLLTSGGIEGNNVLAHSLKKKIYKDGKAFYYESLFFFLNKTYLNGYIYRTPHPSSDPQGFITYGDIGDYLEKINTKKGNNDYPISNRIEDYNELKKEAMWNLLDPLLLESIWHIGKYLLFGEDIREPIFKRFIPGTRYNLTPFGAEAYLDFYIKSGSLFLNPYLRKGDGPDGRFYGCGIEIEKPIKRLLICSNIDWWKQPIKENGYFLSSNFTKDITSWLGLITEVGLKTEGYLMGKEFNKVKYVTMGLDVVF